LKDAINDPATAEKLALHQEIGARDGGLEGALEIAVRAASPALPASGTLA